MKKQKSMNNKGFSLVELIIVIAIMAILIGVMAPNLLKYVENSRVSKDMQAVDSVHTAIVTAMLDPTVDKLPTEPYDSLAELYKDNTNYPKFVTAVQEIVNEKTASKVEGAAFESKAFKDQNIKITIESNKVRCEVAVNKGVTGVDPIVIE